MNNAVQMIIGLIVLLAGAWTLIAPACFGQSGMVCGLG
jgi:hypothetical protein